MQTFGHLYIIQGDIKKIACDAWLLPTSDSYSITISFQDAVGMTVSNDSKPLEWGGDKWTEPWGDRNFILLKKSEDLHEPDLWIGNIGVSDLAPVTHFADRAREFVKLACETVRMRETKSNRAPLIAVNVIGSGHGGGRNKRGELLGALIPKLVESARENLCDVVLVTYGSVMYSAANSVRNKLPTELDVWRDLPKELIASGDELAKSARNSELVVFMGAGVSRDAGLPTWKELLHDVAIDVGITEEEFDEIAKFDPRDQATLLSKDREDEFRKAVSNRLSSERYSLLHGLLASLPVNEFVTTNFDNLFELAAARSGEELPVIPGGVVSAGKRWLLKLHGTIGQDLVLTRGEYLGAVSTHAALRGLVQAMLLTRHMLFVGYSMNDEDFHQLVHEVRTSVKDHNNKSFGTVTLLQGRQHLSRLWPDLSFVYTDVGINTAGDLNPEDLNPSARNLAIMLDYVGAKSASDIGFVADETFGKMKTEHELELSQILKDLEVLVEKMDIENGKSEKWGSVREFLDEFREKF